MIISSPHHNSMNQDRCVLC